MPVHDPYAVLYMGDIQDHGSSPQKKMARICFAVFLYHIDYRVVVTTKLQTTTGRMLGR